jgi:sugar-specific transcriptional regulator TrmB
MKKGLVSYIIKSKKKFFEATHPNKLLEILNEEKQSISEKEALLKSLLPELAAIKGFSAKKQQVTIYEGVEGVKAIFEDILKTKKVNHVLGAWKYPHILKYYLHHWHRRRIKAKLLDKMLFKKSAYKRALEFSKLPYTKVRVLPGSFHSPLAINVYEEKIAFIIGSKETPLAVLIKDKSIAKDFKNYFDALWKLSDKIH